LLEATEHAILVVSSREDALDGLIALAEPLARSKRPRELILARLTSPSGLHVASALLHERRDALIARGTAARAAVFTSRTPGDDVVRLASEQQVDLLLDEATELLDEGVVSPDLAIVLEGAPCDVAVLLARDSDDPAVSPAGPVLVPFGGADHDCAALELGAWLAGTREVALKVAGVSADLEAGGRDASRLLAQASLIVQKVAGVAAEPVLVEPSEAGLVAAAADAGLLVVGLPQEWRQKGLGPVRLAVARSARPPVLIVRRGLRPGGLAPPETQTRFT
jgi:hypothetical protein